jgi:hypothetical protein
VLQIIGPDFHITRDGRHVELAALSAKPISPFTPGALGRFGLRRPVLLAQSGPADKVLGVEGVRIARRGG